MSNEDATGALWPATSFGSGLNEVVDSPLCKRAYSKPRQQIIVRGLCQNDTFRMMLERGASEKVLGIGLALRRLLTGAYQTGALKRVRK
jgi:hypothetical protein